MPWERKWEGCKEYSRWEKDGVTWTVEDVNPEDHDTILELMSKHFLPEAPMAMRLYLHKDETSLNAVKNFWAKGLSQRSSLVCYCHFEGGKEIAAINICPVNSVDDPILDTSMIKHDGIRTLIATLQYIEEKSNVFDIFQIKHYLSGSGLLVLPKFRGERLGARVLAAREPMCRMLGIPATVTFFTGPASQSLASRAGFQNLFDITFGQLSDKGFHYPGDQTKVLKMMFKIY